MTLAERVLQLKQDIDLVYQAGISDAGGPPPKREILIGKDYDTLNLQVRDNTIYNISHYSNIFVSPPTGVYQAYLYIDLPVIEDASITFASSIPISGNQVSEAKPGETWEASMDSSLGTLLLNSSKRSHESVS
jgi:hypothetical protein